MPDIPPPSSLAAILEQVVRQEWGRLVAALIREPQGGIGPGAMWHAAFVGLVAAPIGTWAVIESGRLLNAVTASVGFLLVPVLGLGLSAFWLHEPMGWDLVIGGALIVASVVVAAKG